jgi:hypothetical protein
VFDEGQQLSDAVHRAAVQTVHLGYVLDVQQITSLAAGSRDTSADVVLGLAGRRPAPRGVAAVGASDFSPCVPTANDLNRLGRVFLEALDGAPSARFEYQISDVRTHVVSRLPDLQGSIPELFRLTS